MKSFIVILSTLLLLTFTLTSPVMAKPHNNIVEVQIRLTNLGYNIGHADGVLGKRTVDAIRQFQRANHLPPTGKIDKQTQQRLLKKSAPQKVKYQKPAKKHSNHPIGYNQSLFKAQKRLAKLGYHPGKIDGVMGKQTQIALKRFQRDHHLPVTGQLDNRTYKKLQ